MTKPRRHPCAKQRFLEGNRQKWAAVLILCAFGILMADVYEPSIDPEPYLSFLTVIGGLFILGMSVDSFAKIKTAPTPTPEEIHDDPEYYEPNQDQAASTRPA